MSSGEPAVVLQSSGLIPGIGVGYYPYFNQRRKKSTWKYNSLCFFQGFHLGRNEHEVESVNSVNIFISILFGFYIILLLHIFFFLLKQ